MNMNVNKNSINASMNEGFDVEIEASKPKKSRKTIDELTLSDSFMFYAVMQDYDLCKETLEVLLDIKIAKIKYIIGEKVMKPSYDGKGIRLDVYVEDDMQTVYNLEMQVENKKHIPKRTRYYQSVIDWEQLLQGEDYDSLKETLIIFICKFDMYKECKPKYTFKYMCKEVKGLELGDETSKVIYNTTAVNDDNKTYKDLNISKRLYNLLRYVEKQEINDKFTKKLDEKVNSIKKDNDWREKHMQYELNIQDAKREGIAIGKTEGIAIGKNEGIREGQENIIKKMLESGMSYEEVSRIVDMSVDLVKRYAGEIIKA